MIATDFKLINIHCHMQNSGSSWHMRSIDMSELDANPALLTRQSQASIGIHPWFIAQQNIEQSLLGMQALSSHPNVIAIGECGLDKCIATDLALQIQVFNRHIALADQIGKPVIVHCVRAFNELLQCHQQLRPTLPWIVHGFVGKAPLARQLVHHGLYLSFGKALLKQSSHACLALQAIPIEQVFLETDDSVHEISEIYAAAAKILGLELPALQRQLVANFERVFAHD